MNTDLLLQKSFTYELNIPEKLLRYVRIIILGEHIVNKTDNFSVYGETYSEHEVDSSLFAYSFKQIGTDKYQIVINLGIYINTQESVPPVNPVNLTIFISYINTQGNYELRKYKA
jgi:hypothetical protein